MIHSHQSQFDFSAKPARLTYQQAPENAPQQRQQMQEGDPGKQEKPKSALDRGANWIGQQILEGTRTSIKFLMSDSNPIMRVLRYHRFPAHQLPFKSFAKNKAGAIKDIGEGFYNTARTPLSFANQVASTPLDFVDVPWKVSENLSNRGQSITDKPTEALKEAYSDFREGIKGLFGIK